METGEHNVKILRCARRFCILPRKNASYPPRACKVEGKRLQCSQVNEMRVIYMKVILHDLDQSYGKIIEANCDRMISADGKYAPCQGCFGC